MISIPKRYSHFLFGLIQSGFTCAIAAGIASTPFIYVRWRIHRPLVQVLDYRMGDDDTVCSARHTAHPPCRECNNERHPIIYDFANLGPLFAPGFDFVRRKRSRMCNSLSRISAQKI